MRKLKDRLIARTGFILEQALFANATKENPAAFTRKRILSFKSIIAFVLNSNKKSLQLEVDEFVEMALPQGTTVGKDAVVKARKKIGYEAFETLYRGTVDVAMEEDALPRTRGYRVYAIDGTELVLPNTPDIQDHLGAPKGAGRRMSARVSCLCELSTGYTIEAVLDSYQVSERAQAQKLLETLSSYKGKKDLILFDRGYPSHALISEIACRGQYFLMRVSTSFNEEVDAQTEPEGIVELGVSGSRVRTRVIKLPLVTGEVETLLTNLPGEDFKHEEFTGLYARRWGIETEYDLLKNVFQLENFTGKTHLTIMQDFYATCYMANMAVSIAEEASQELAARQEGKAYKHEHKINKQIVIGRFKRAFIKILLAERLEDAYEKLDMLVAQATRCYYVNSTNPPPARATKNAHHKKSIARKRAF